MRPSRLWNLLLLLALLARGPSTVQAQSNVVEVLTLHDTLQPVRARAFARQIAAANSSGVEAILINLSTPGGMPDATDTMVDAIRNSRIPVIVWVGMPLSRVGGQGLRLIAEADLAYMSHDTYLTPLWADIAHGLSRDRRIAASQQLLEQLTAAAQFHARSTAHLGELTWGSRWFTPAEAVSAGLVDGLGDSAPEIIAKSSGHTITRGEHSLKLVFHDVQLKPMTTEGENFLLLALMNPNLNVLLLTLGLLLIYLEINTPGIVVPGAAGLLVVLLTGFALGSLPVSPIGILLCVLALALLLLESRLHTRGILATLGILTLVIGLKTLVKGPIPQLQVAWSTAIGAGIGFGGVTAALIVLAGEAKRSKVKLGSDAMLGWLAIAHTPLTPTGRILVRGELWNARLTSDDTSVAAGDRVKVLRADGLTLEVTAVPLTQS